MEKQHIVRKKELSTIPLLHKIYDAGGVICGGFARHIASSNKNSIAQDIDVYSMGDSESEALDALFEKTGLKNRDTNYHGVSVSNYTLFEEDGDPRKIQLVHTAGSPEQVIVKFDFTVCQAFLDLSQERVLTSQEWKYHEDARMLRIANREREFLDWRLLKYMDKGYSPDFDAIMSFSTGVEPESMCRWLAKIYKRLGESSRSLRDQVSVLGQLIDNETFKKYLDCQTAVYFNGPPV